MSRARPVSFEVHRSALPKQPAPADSLRAPSFTDLLRQRRPSSGARPFGERLRPEAEPSSSHAPAEDELAVSAEPEHAAPVTREPEPEQQAEPDWADELIPSPELLQPLLHGTTRVARVAAPPHPLVAAIAQTISRFCNDRAVDDSEGWQVRMPLRPDVLADTTLTLAVSSCWLQLRFETADSKARDLLFAHRDALAATLEESLNRRRDVAISID
ncbi:type III secretion system protein SctP [Rhizobacter sp. OV335]|uniref:type III secretion system protein SctP n=1 Tax=Rhizobacter sp. OV335 TaxID=1500264 RepID=UPI00090F8CD0|nr:type III secretion system protein SctP [Rhizobacter sp. OV335]SHN21946.1 type III secretion control protein HpaP [Rhizobacter sp. OV335]